MATLRTRVTASTTAEFSAITSMLITFGGELCEETIAFEEGVWKFRILLPAEEEAGFVRAKRRIAAQHSRHSAFA